MRRGNEPRHAAVGPTPCDACKTAVAQSALSTVQYAGFEMVLCIEPVACRLRAQRKGIWKVYTGQ